MKTTLIILMALSTAACSSKIAPRDQYVKALNQRLEGNPTAYYDGMLKLAVEEPESRAGRRAKATLQGGSIMTTVAITGILAAIAIPNFLKFQARAKQSEAKTNLKRLFVALKSTYVETGRYCRTFETCGFTPDPTMKYLYFMGRDEIVGGAGADSVMLLRMRAMPVLEALNIEPGITRAGFTFVAVGDIDGDDELDVWTINQDNDLVNAQNDAE
ncbi:MAG: hypothetical protein A2289_10100 [Deltaproteobacteria bacterium RIFOXYA12_FULL_58_15]|nr:MAG: hypothetical protein A2289_10100 [Deltaproteobacteria bacterium RIFOXYA12_FULL_58_15]OGR08177.1 MAG: hypothetical protein A2341_20145 [Deltaproteobacteria bacterium RIFOXYB12_FULL_58_9]